MAILVPVADGPLRDAVLDTAIELGACMNQPLHVVHLVDEAVANSEAKRIRDALREKLDTAGVETTVSLEYVGHSGPRSGTRIGQDILELAADVDITHIVMGHATQGFLHEVANGSAAVAVIDNATVPVTVVPDGIDGV